MWLEVVPKKLFGALSGVVMTAAPGRKETQTQSFAALGVFQIAPQGVADQGRNREIFSLGQEVQLPLCAFFKKKRRSFHMLYDAIRKRAKSMGGRSGNSF